MRSRRLLLIATLNDQKSLERVKADCEMAVNSKTVRPFLNNDDRLLATSDSNDQSFISCMKHNRKAMEGHADSPQLGLRIGPLDEEKNQPAWIV